MKGKRYRDDVEREEILKRCSGRGDIKIMFRTRRYQDDIEREEISR